MPYRFVLDSLQTRVTRDAIITGITGLANPDTRERGWKWEYATSVDTWSDPVNHVLMLKPAPLHAAWQTTGTGIYSRLKKVDFSIPTASKWVDDIKNGGASSFLKCLDSTLNEGVVSTTTWDKNRGFYLGWYASNWGSEDFQQISCGWNSSASTAAGVGLKFSSGGDLEVYKNGELLERVQWSGGRTPQQSARSFVSVLLIPYRQRELLVYSSLGHGTSIVFDDILDDDPNPTITPASNFWVKVESGVAEFECAPLRYPTSGHCVSLVRHLKEPPPSSADSPTFTTFYSVPGYGTQGYEVELVEEDGSTSFVPDGSTTTCRFKVTLTSDGESTSYIYGATAEWPVETGFTDDSESTELLDYIISATLQVQEHSGNTSLNLTLKEPDSWDPDILFRQSNRPFSFENNLGVKLIDGRTEPISWKEASNDEARNVDFSIKTVLKAVENYVFPDDVPLDGLRFKKAFEIPLKRVGLTDDELDIDDIEYTFPVGGPNADGGYNLVIKAGDKGLQWLDQLRSTYAPLHNLDVVPTSTGIQVRLADDIKLGATPKMTLYLTSDEAIAYWVGLGFTEAEARTLAPRRHIRVADEANIEPEANDVWCIGLDRRRLRPIIARKRSDADIDPTLPPSMRGDNWLGELRRYSWVDNTLTTIEACERAVEILYKRLAHRRQLLEVEVDWMLDENGVPLWRGDVVTIHGWGDYRICAFTTNMELIGDANPYGSERRTTWLQTKYVLERLGIDATACGHNSQGGSLREIVEYYATSLLEAIGGPGTRFPGIFQLEPVEVLVVP